MAQVHTHTVLGNGDHELVFDDDSKIVVAANKVPVGAGWGEVLAAAGFHESTGNTPLKKK